MYNEYPENIKKEVLSILEEMRDRYGPRLRKDNHFPSMIPFQQKKKYLGSVNTLKVMKPCIKDAYTKEKLINDEFQKTHRDFIAPQLYRLPNGEEDVLTSKELETKYKEREKMLSEYYDEYVKLANFYKDFQDSWKVELFTYSNRYTWELLKKTKIIEIDRNMIFQGVKENNYYIGFDYLYLSPVVFYNREDEHYMPEARSSVFQGTTDIIYKKAAYLPIDINYDRMDAVIEQLGEGQAGVSTISLEGQKLIVDGTIIYTFSNSNKKAGMILLEILISRYTFPQGNFVSEEDISIEFSKKSIQSNPYDTFGYVNSKILKKFPFKLRSRMSSKPGIRNYQIIYEKNSN